jgi:hypothetical protein
MNQKVLGGGSLRKTWNRFSMAGALMAVLPALMLTPSLQAQNVSIVRANSIEVGPFVGATYGLDKTRLLVGGNATYAVTRYILPYVEYSYFKGFVRTESIPALNDTATTKVPFHDIHGGVHLRLPIRESPLVPYGVFGLGVLIYPERQQTFASGRTALTIPRESNFAVNFGGGFRYYVGQRWGARLEGKVYKPTGRFEDVVGKLEVGLFYQFR